MNEPIDVTPEVQTSSEPRIEEQHPSGSPIRCAIYARNLRWRSSKEEPVEEQIETCLAAAREQEMLVTEGHIYCDNRRSDVTFGKRVGLNGLLDAARSESHPFDIVLIDNNSRFSRKYFEILSVYSALSKAGVKVRVVPACRPDLEQAL
jgi:site-specific DNA recombinase